MWISGLRRNIVLYVVISVSVELANSLLWTGKVSYPRNPQCYNWSDLVVRVQKLQWKCLVPLHDVN